MRAARGEGDLPPPAELADVDLVAIDYHLDDGCTGPLLAARLRESLGRDVPVILVTADGADAIRAEAEALGAVFLRKPVEPLALRTAMRRLLDALPTMGDRR